MHAVADHHNTAAFAPQLGRVAVSAATSQYADVFARRDRQETTTSHRPSKRSLRRIDGILRIDDQAVVVELEPDAQLPSWVSPVLQSLSDRWGMEPGWDSYQAKPTDVRCVARLLNYLSIVMRENSTPPIVTPLSDGGVQAEWHQHNEDLELVVQADEPARYYYYNAAAEEEEEEELELNYPRVQQLIDRF